MEMHKFVMTGAFWQGFLFLSAIAVMLIVTYREKIGRFVLGALGVTKRKEHNEYKMFIAALARHDERLAALVVEQAPDFQGLLGFAVIRVMYRELGTLSSMVHPNVVLRTAMLLRAEL
ncbi:hypothetical protein ACP3V3_16835 [Vibrio sp. PNB22_3_1]